MTGRPLPGPLALTGRSVRLEPLAPAHAAPLHAGFAGHDALWDFMAYGPFDAAGYAAWVAARAGQGDPMFAAILPAGGAAAGVLAVMRIEAAMGVAEIGHICLAPALQRTVAATEAIHLALTHLFALGYRRVEWKCDARNLPSRRAAERLGFSFEGVFRQHMIVKGRNRDTAWFAMTDGDWTGGVGAAQRCWLDPANFDGAGRQRMALAALTAPCLVARDPGAGRG
jgi:RimJ/RimL family protein N-acetyltransferase